MAWQGARHGGAGLVGRHAERREALARAWPKARFAAEAERVVGSLPAWFRERVENVAFFVAEWPSSEVLREMGIEDPLDLLGLYRGVPLPERGGGAGYGHGELPDTVHLYRQPILAWCAETGEDVAACIRETVLHELGHYLGLDDETLERLEGGIG